MEMNISLNTLFYISKCLLKYPTHTNFFVQSFYAGETNVTKFSEQLNICMVFVTFCYKYFTFCKKYITVNLSQIVGGIKMLDMFATVSTLLLLVTILYWAYFLDKNKNDERGDQIVGKAAKISFSSLFVIMGFITIFYYNERITPDFLFDYMIIGLSVGALIHAVSLFLYDRKYQ